jgi:putative DNA primase/helicase
MAQPEPKAAALRLVGQPRPPEPPQDERPEVRIDQDVGRNVDALDDALGAADRTLYHRARRLVHVLPAVNVLGVADETPVIREMTAPALLTHIARRVDCRKWLKNEDGERGGEWRIAPAPHRTAVEPLLAQGHWRSIKPLRAIVEAPTLRPDGTVLQVPGYDEASGLLYTPGATFPAVPDAPTQDEAKAALWELANVFCDFPHLSAAHRAVPIAALLTILARPAIDGPCPAFIFDATVRGSGKTLQGDVVHAIASGRRPPHSSLNEQEEEREKVIAGVALKGAPVIFIDNVKGLFGGPMIEAALTSSVVGFRLFGTQQLMEMPWSAVMLVSGNNLQMTDDMMRRCLTSRLESPLEDPTTRTEFAHPELIAWALKERPRLLVLALTMLRSFISHGSPDAGVGTIGEPYGAWCRLIANTIVYCGGANVLDCRPPRESGGLDEAASLRTLLEGWRRIDPTDSGMTAGQIVRALSKESEGPDGVEDLREALETLSPPRSHRVDPRALGYALRRYRGRWVGNVRLVSAMGHNKQQRWRVENRQGQLQDQPAGEPTESR